MDLRCIVHIWTQQCGWWLRHGARLRGGLDDDKEPTCGVRRTTRQERRAGVDASEAGAKSQTAGGRVGCVLCPSPQQGC